MRKSITSLLLLLIITNFYAQLDNNSLLGIPTVDTTANMNAIPTPINTGNMVYNLETQSLFVYNGTSWISTSNTNWETTGNAGLASTNFLGTTDDVKMEIRSNDTPLLQFGRRQTLGLTQIVPDYNDDDQPLVLLNGDGNTSALQFTASGAGFYRPMFFTTTNGSFRLKGSTGQSDLFELGSAGPNNDGRLEFAVGDDGTEPIVFKRFHYNGTSGDISDDFYRELFRVQGATNTADAKTRFGININTSNQLVSANISAASNDASNVMANSTLQINGSISKSITTTTGNITLSEDEYTVILGGNHTIGLPPAGDCEGRVYIIKNPNNFATTIDAYINETGTAGITTINNNSILKLQSDGTNWQQINNQNSSITTTVFDGYNTTGGQVISNQNGFTKLNLNTARVNNGGFTFTNNEITVPTNGLYKITYTVILQNSSTSRSGARSILRINNTTNVVASDVHTYHRREEGGNVANNVHIMSGSRTVVLNLTAGQTIAIYAQKFEGTITNNIRTFPGSSIIIERLN